MFKYLSLIILLILSTSLVSCGQDSHPREYTEVIVQSTAPEMASMAGSVAAPATHASLRWTTPPAWQEKAGEGFRLVTFTNTGDQPMECSISSIGQMMGDLKANILRWVGQIHLENISEDELNQFINNLEHRKSDGGFELTVIDLSKLAPTAGADTQTMTVAMFKINDETFFVKMTGTKSAVSANLESFNALCQSLRP